MDEKSQPEATPDGKMAEDRKPEDERPPGVPGGTAGAGGDNKVQDELSR